MKFGLVGLPASGKTSVFNAILGLSRSVGTYSEKAAVDRATARLADERLDQLAATVGSKKASCATVDLADVTALLTGSGTAREVDGEILHAVRQMDAYLVVLRAFEDAGVLHPLGSVDPARDLAEVETELVVADLGIVERRIERLEANIRKGAPTREADAQEAGVLRRCREALEAGGAVRDVALSAEEERRLHSFSFLTRRPFLVVFNTSEGALSDAPSELVGRPCVAVSAKIESELAELDESERAAFAESLSIKEPAAGRVLGAALSALGMGRFYTAGPREARAWLFREGETALDCAGKVHSDIARGFIACEVVRVEDVVAHGGYKAAKAAGCERVEGKEYRVRDGDVLTVRFSA